MLPQCPYDALELLSLILGIRRVQEPPKAPANTTGWDYYCQRSTDEKGHLILQKRELAWFWQTSASLPLDGGIPNGTIGSLSAMHNIPHWQWLLGQLLLERIFDTEPACVSLQHPPEKVFDLLDQHLTHDMPNWTAHTRKLTSPDAENRFEFKSSLLLTKTNFETQGKNAQVFSIGLRRQSKNYRPGEEHNNAICLDSEVLMPLFALDHDWQSLQNLSAVPAPLNRIQFGMLLSRDGHTLGLEKEPELNRIRCTFSAKLDVVAQQLQATEPVVHTQKQDRNKNHWQSLSPKQTKSLVDQLLKQEQVQAILDSPLGPFSVEEVDDDALGWYEPLIGPAKSLKKIKADFKKFRDDLKAARANDQNFWQAPADKNDKVDPNTGLRHVGQLLQTLGILKGKPKAYKSNDWSALKPWPLLLELFKEFDGFPLYFKNPKPEKQAVEEDHHDADQDNDNLIIDDEQPEHNDTKHYPTSGGLQFALVDSLASNFHKWLGFRGFAQNIPLISGHQVEPDEKHPARETEILLQLGKYFSGETLASNWITRLQGSKIQPRTALPGIALFPLIAEFKPNESDQADLNFAWNFRADLVSLGLDIQGANKTGLFKGKGLQLGGVELRLLLNLDSLTDKEWLPRFAMAAKLCNLRINFEPAKTHDPWSVDELIGGLLPIAGNDKQGDEDQAELKTRLSSKTKDQFSLSLGYMLDASKNQPHAFDLQLYDAKNRPGKKIWIKVERRLGPLYLKDIGLAISGFNAMDDDKDWQADKAAMTLVASGGIRASGFELGLIGCGLKFNLQPFKTDFQLDGLDIAFRAGSIAISGGFLKDEHLYAGHLRIDTPVFTIAAIGAYGQEPDPENENETFTSLFIYGSFSANEGGGISILGIVKVTGAAAGFGINRAIVTPKVHEVAEFPLVKIVMGEGAVYDPDDPKEEREPIAGDPRSILSKPADVNKLLPSLKDHLIAKRGAFFGAFGVRFSLFELIDCFALLIAQASSDPEDFEIMVLGLARLSLPKTTADNQQTKAICYLEIQLSASLKPFAGTLLMQAQISPNSWLLHQDCRITGGGAVAWWFGPKQQGDFIFTLGGYHPRFRRPNHYPVVPRLGIHWLVNENLVIKADGYSAINLACVQAGFRFEAKYHQRDIDASFNVIFDLLVNWAPVSYDIRMAINVHLQVKLIKTWDLSLGIDCHIWGPPFGMRVLIDIALVTIPIEFGEPQDDQSKVLQSWPQFGRTFLDSTETIIDDKPIPANSQDTRATGKWAQPTRQTPLVSGPSLLKAQLVGATPPPATEPTQTQTPWLIDPDQLAISVQTSVPVQQLQVGQVDPEHCHANTPSATDLTRLEPLTMTKTKTFKGRKVRVKPMERGITSNLQVGIVNHHSHKAVDLSQWHIETEQQDLPSATWYPNKDNAHQLDAKAASVKDCLVGLKTLKPPDGEASGHRASQDPQACAWHKLDARDTQDNQPQAVALEDVMSALGVADADLSPAKRTAKMTRRASPPAAEPGWAQDWRNWKRSRRQR